TLAMTTAAQDEVYFPTTEWRTSTPEEQGMNSAVLAEMVGSLRYGTEVIHSILVVRDGYVVLDASPYPFRADQPHWLFSSTKSVISTLVGVAIEQGLIESVDQSIWYFFPQETVANMDERKAAITIRDLLIHSSGLSLGESGDIGMYSLTADDQSWVEYVLNMPMMFSPGNGATYLDANAHLVSAIIGEATGMSASQFAQETLFASLGISDAPWQSDPQGVNWGGDGLSLSPYDVAKLGYLYLNNGEWAGQQLLPSTWIEAATSEQNRLVTNSYGYLWWVGAYGEHPFFVAMGLGGQEIWVIPDEDLVVVITGDGEEAGGRWIEDYILAAIVGDGALPANVEAQAALAASIEALAAPVSADVPPIPAAIADVAGQMIVLEDNPLRWDSLSLTFSEDEAFLLVDVAGTPLELPFGLDGVYRVSHDGVLAQTAALPTGPFWRPLTGAAVAGRLGRIGDDWLIIHAWDLSGGESWDIRLRFKDVVTVTVATHVVPDTVRIGGVIE
ncbi:MAG: serine hydrolase, partial [Anaerolineae bacterium]|nr:serine hydrolase [Anaerolineae bacterium]